MAVAFPKVFTNVPWCKVILEDPNFTIVYSHDNQTKFVRGSPFIGTAMEMGKVIGARVMLNHIPIKGSPFPVTENRVLLDLGPGSVGQKGISHGGFLAAVMDEVAGNLINNNALDGGMDPYTVQLNMSYKKTIRAPGVILASSKIVKVEGRKIFVYATIQDNPDTVGTSCELIFLRKRESL